MNNSSSVSSVSQTATSSSKLNNTQNKNKDSIDDVITINEKVNLTKQQHQVLKTICDTYEISLSEYIQQALVEAMRFDIEEGNFSDALLEKLGGEDSKKYYNSSPSSTSPDSLGPSLTNSDLDLIKKLQTEIS
jgi:anti-sigma28 factor (negative regulator of flagellin synthesis)